jgi:hypothetical protein
MIVYADAGKRVRALFDVFQEKGNAKACNVFSVFNDCVLMTTGIR